MYQRNLTLVKSENFGNVNCDLWQNEQGDILMTREQIGTALEYAYPQEAIQKIHERNIDRLSQFSGQVKLTSPKGGTQETYVYTSKGIMEICRFSRQPKADAFIDWVWDVVETIRKTGMYAMENHSVKQYMSMCEEDRAILYFQQMKDKKELEQQKALLAPKADMFDTFMNAENVQDIAKVAKTLGTGRNRLYAMLREKKRLMENNLPYQPYIDNGYFVVVQVPVKIGETTIDKPQTYVTPKGIAYISKLMKNGEVAVS